MTLDVTARGIISRTYGVPVLKPSPRRGQGGGRWHHDPSILGICPQLGLRAGTQEPKKADSFLRPLPQPLWSVKAQPGT